MKKALFLILDEYADWEGAYLSSTLNQREDKFKVPVTTRIQSRDFDKFWVVTGTDFIAYALLRFYSRQGQ